MCFLLQTEVHVYSFAVAVNVLISFFPFLVAMIILCRSVFHWQAGVDVIIQTVNNYFPEGFGVNFRGYLWRFVSQIQLALGLSAAVHRQWHFHTARSGTQPYLAD